MMIKRIIAGMSAAAMAASMLNLPVFADEGLFGTDSGSGSIVGTDNNDGGGDGTSNEDVVYTPSIFDAKVFGMGQEYWAWTDELVSFDDDGIATVSADPASLNPQQEEYVGSVGAVVTLKDSFAETIDHDAIITGNLAYTLSSETGAYKTDSIPFEIKWIDNAFSTISIDLYSYGEAWNTVIEGGEITFDAQITDLSVTIPEPIVYTFPWDQDFPRCSILSRRVTALSLRLTMR